MIRHRIDNYETSAQQTQKELKGLKAANQKQIDDSQKVLDDVSVRLDVAEMTFKKRSDMVLAYQKIASGILKAGDLPDAPVKKEKKKKR
jgi:hypothetical protein